MRDTVITINHSYGKVETINLMDGDSFIFEPPDTKYWGRGAVLQWKYDRMEKANKVLRALLEQERTEVDLQYVDSQDLIEELASRLQGKA